MTEFIRFTATGAFIAGQARKYPKPLPVVIPVDAVASLVVQATTDDVMICTKCGEAHIAAESFDELASLLPLRNPVTAGETLQALSARYGAETEKLRKDLFESQMMTVYLTKTIQLFSGIACKVDYTAKFIHPAIVRMTFAVHDVDDRCHHFHVEVEGSTIRCDLWAAGSVSSYACGNAENARKRFDEFCKDRAITIAGQSPVAAIQAGDPHALETPPAQAH